jgi:hypothetical protein
MNKFLLKLLLFVVPMVLLLGAIEWYIRNSNNSFIAKAKHFNKNKQNIEVLVLGTSHNQNGVNPKFFREKTSNLAYASQNIQIDSAVFFTNVKQMNNLKKVVFEMDYHRMDLDTDDKTYRLAWYYLYYGIEIYPVKWINKWSLYSSNTSFFNNVILDDFTNSDNTKVINEFGFVEKNFNNEFVQFNYNAQVINAKSKQRLKNKHKEFSDEAFEKNKKRIESIIRFCQKNNIELYFFSSPLYPTYIENKIPKKEARFKNYIKELISNYKIKYYNFEESKQFKVTDFSNEDHLNDVGAEKYSKLMDSIINQ